jgi:inorganic pyrophosphatase/exopolyphosphatase
MIESILLSMDLKCFTYNGYQIGIRKSTSNNFDEILEEFLSIVQELKQNKVTYTINNGFNIEVRPY